MAKGLMDKVEALQCEDDIRGLQLCIYLMKKIDPANIAPDREHGLNRLRIMQKHLRTCENHARRRVAREFLYQ